ncbi:hypothetical protein GD1_160 [Paraglaciecola Antarctic GD virus 1]|nr:hypothetical protein GD1_160 [Paraglaciecola Antarctic GD virus 1]
MKLQFIYRGLPFTSENPKFNWHVKVYDMLELVNKNLSELSDIHGICELVAVRRCIDVQDIHGNDIFEGDNVNHTMPNTTFSKGDVIIGTIEYIDVCCSFRTCNDWIGDEPIHEDIKLEVIGNKYQNPMQVAKI